MAMMNLIHFGTRPEFRIQDSEASRNKALEFTLQRAGGTSRRLNPNSIRLET
jgi:hypothetical protein